MEKVFVKHFTPDDKYITAENMEKIINKLTKDYDKYCYSLRVDIIEYGETIKHLNDFFRKFSSGYYIVAYEEESKSKMVKVKPHFHAFFYNFSANHDTMRRHLTQLGYPASMCMLKQSSKSYKLEQTIHYTLKHGNVCFYDITNYKIQEVQLLIHMAIDYNSNIKHNKGAEGLDLVVQQLKILQEEQLNKKSDTDHTTIYIPGNAPLIRSDIVLKTIYKVYRPADITIPVGYKLKELLVKIGNQIYDEDAGYNWWRFVDNAII